jgi:hypothetical protein
VAAEASGIEPASSIFAMTSFGPPNAGPRPAPPRHADPEVKPTEQSKCVKAYETCAPLLGRLAPEARKKLLEGDCERLFDRARRNARAWERAGVSRQSVVVGQGGMTRAVTDPSRTWR